MPNPPLLSAIFISRLNTLALTWAHTDSGLHYWCIEQAMVEHVTLILSLRICTALAIAPGCCDGYRMTSLTKLLGKWLTTWKFAWSF